MPRVNTVAKARKAQGTCGKCGDEIGVGEGYRWIKFRHGGRHVRCMKPECRFRASDLTQSKMSAVYAAQDNAEDSIGDCGSIEDLKSLAEETADAIEGVAQEYRDSADAIHEHFEVSATADECEERADALEGWADTIRDSMDEFCDEFEPAEPDDVSCPECGADMKQNETRGTWDCTAPEDDDCGVTNYSPKDDPEADRVDDEGRTEEEYLEAAREALASAISEYPL